MELLEKCSFFDSGEGGFLYGCTYLPRVNQKEISVVLVPPLGRERLRCYRESANLARDLARHGYPVIRFDYRGEGESSGAFIDATMATRVDDIQQAVKEIQRQCGNRQICLIGIHVGALLAVQATERVATEYLLLCDPVCNPRTYARGLLRTNVVLQTQYYGKVSKKQEDLRADLARGETVSIYGFQLGLALLEELEALDPQPALEAFAGDSAILVMAPKERPLKKDAARWCELLNTRGHCQGLSAIIAFSWTSRRRWMPRLDPLNQAVVQWLEATS